jgi:hypothetical protein
MSEVVFSSDITVSDWSGPRPTGSDAAAVVAHEIIFGYEVLIRRWHWDRIAADAAPAQIAEVAAQTPRN